MTLRYVLPAALALLVYGGAGAQSYRAPVEWEVNVEGGLDLLRREYLEVGQDYGPDVLVRGARQASPGYFVGVSAMRRLAGLRALWGLRLDGHAGAITLDEQPGYSVTNRTATATLAYRFFPLDLHGDCDCPTWGDDAWLKKALFLEAGLGLGYQRYGAEAAAQPSRDRVGLGYVGRVGFSHRLSTLLDVFAAVGLHGVFAENEAFPFNDYALRPTLGMTWRPGR